jgi:hypothetical protein
MWILEQLGFSSSFSVKYLQIEWLNLDRVQLGSMINGMQGRGMPLAGSTAWLERLAPVRLIRVLAPGRQRG